MSGYSVDFEPTRGSAYSYRYSLEAPRYQRGSVAFRGNIDEQFMVSQPPKKEKVGFWEGVGAIAKGFFVNTLKTIVTHPIKSLLFAAAGAALIIGTGGAATPFLLAAGAAIGGVQMGKGVVCAAMSDNREETLQNLESIGEGAFSIAASAVGAKFYLGSNSATTANVAKLGTDASKMAKVAAYAKGLGQDTWNVVKMAPESFKTSLAMWKSGHFTANLQNAIGSKWYDFKAKHTTGDDLKLVQQAQRNFENKMYAKINDIGNTYITQAREGNVIGENLTQQIYTKGLTELPNITRQNWKTFINPAVANGVPTAVGTRYGVEAFTANPKEYAYTPDETQAFMQEHYGDAYQQVG